MHTLRLWIFASLALFFPFFVFAASTGFPDQSIWLSKTAPQHGEEVLVYALLYNGTGAAVKANLTFLVDDRSIHSEEISLSPQSSQVIGAKWIAESGNHTFSAQFGGAEGSIAAQTTNEIQVAVAAPAPPSALEQTLKGTTQTIERFASSSSPIVMQAAEKIFETTEAIRIAGVEKLAEYIENKTQSKTILSNSGRATTTIVKGFASSSAPVAAAEDSSSFSFNTVAQTAAAGAHFVMGSIYLFYPIAALVLFFLLGFAYRRLRRPKY